MFQTKKQHSKNKIGSSDRASIAPGQLRSNYGKSRRGSLLQQVGRRQQQPMNEQPSSKNTFNNQKERSGRTRSTPLPTRSPPHGGGLHMNVDDFLDSPRRSPRGLGSNRVVTRRSNDFINGKNIGTQRIIVYKDRLSRSTMLQTPGQMQRHRQNQHQSNQIYNTQVSSSSRQQPLGLQHRGIRVNDNPFLTTTSLKITIILETKHLAAQNPSRSEPQQNDTPRRSTPPGGIILHAKSNRPLNYDEFDDIPPEKIQRVINKLYVFSHGRKPEEAIKKIMRNAYNEHWPRTTHLAGIKKEDSIYMCNTFPRPFQEDSAAAKAKEIYHSLRCNDSFAGVEYDLPCCMYGVVSNLSCFVSLVSCFKITENKPCDAVILFSRNPCNIKRGESSKTPADIYETVYNEQRRGLNKRQLSLYRRENMLRRRQTRRLTNLMNSFFSKHYPSMVSDAAEVCGRDDEDLDVEGQNDEDDYDDMEDNFIRDHPDMEHRNVEEGAGDDE
ncbi:hypothetical protein MKW92_013654 [Papaver armeniacum]|nr:hypothetical protein MKW92_013654 [Papaver armeniacum]